jgi:Zn-dependent M28 family amino/carboxypeptidase
VPVRNWIGFTRNCAPAESASGPALVLEVARQLAAAKLERSLRLVFFDAHEPSDPVSPEPALAGSRALAAEMDLAGELARVRALVVVSRVADRDLRLETSVLAAPELVTRALVAARRLDPPAPLEPLPRAHFDDDHLPFARRGLRAILPLVDLRFGPGEPPGEWTHTPNDAPPNVSRESLGRAGAFVLVLVRSLAVDP